MTTRQQAENQQLFAVVGYWLYSQLGSIPGTPDLESKIATGREDDCLDHPGKMHTLEKNNGQECSW
jgi:hypothetical protein